MLRGHFVEACKTLGEGVEDADIGETDRTREADRFLLDIAKRLRDRKKVAEAKAALKALLDDFPKSAQSAEAARIFGELK